MRAEELALLVREAHGLDLLRLLRARLSRGRLRAISGRPTVVRVCTSSLGTVLVRTHTTDVLVLAEVAAGSYRQLVDVAHDVETIVDLGANVGYATRWLLRRFPTARAVAVEPNSGNAEIARSNLPGVAVIEAFVGGIERSAGQAGDTEFGYRMNGTGTIPVVTMRRVLDELDTTRIDILKCDIEGAEQELFETCSDWIGGVRAMSVECHGDYRAEDLLTALGQNGCALQVVLIDRTPQFACETVVLA